MDKPGYVPPNAIFGIAWPMLQAGVAWGGYRILRNNPGPARNIAGALAVGHLIAIGGWSELFFGGKKLGASVLGSAIMCGAATAYVVQAGRVDRKAAIAGVPYAAWLVFATILATDIWLRNRNRD